MNYRQALSTRFDRSCKIDTAIVELILALEEVVEVHATDDNLWSERCLPKLPNFSDAARATKRVRRARYAFVNAVTAMLKERTRHGGA